MTTSVPQEPSPSRSVRKIYLLGDVPLGALDKLLLLDAVVHGEPVQILAGPEDAGRAQILAQRIEQLDTCASKEASVGERDRVCQEVSALRSSMATLAKACVEVARPHPSDGQPYYRRFERRARWR